MERYEQILMDEVFRAAAFRYIETVEERFGAETLRSILTESNPKELVFREQYLKVVTDELDLGGSSGALAICGYLGSVVVMVEQETKPLEELIRDVAWKALLIAFEVQLHQILQSYEIAGRF